MALHKLTPEQRRMEVFTRADVAYDQLLTASCLAGFRGTNQVIPETLFDQLHAAVDALKEIRDALEPREEL